MNYKEWIDENDPFKSFDKFEKWIVSKVSEETGDKFIECDTQFRADIFAACCDLLKEYSKDALDRLIKNIDRLS